MKKFKAHSERILQMMIHSVYTNKEIFLRELIANACDACDKAKFLSLTDTRYLGDYSIKIECDKEKRILSIIDNGIGMSEKDLENNLGIIAQSDTAEFKNSKSENLEEKLIGQFGVGFYSGFMVADKIVVTSKSVDDNAHVFISDAKGYSIDNYDEDKGEFLRGTRVDLFLKPADEDMDYNELLESDFIESLVKRYSDYIRYPIYVFNSEKPINSMQPIWKRAKQAKKEELDQYFKDKYLFERPPLKVLSYSVEGGVSYRALLFIPQNVPYDYFSVEYERGISLYNSGVMIMENCKELLPDYLAFVKGVIETEDVSLNISRELMQKDRKLTAISKSIEKKILSELEKMLKNERDEYEKFFYCFGSSIKLGIYSSFGVRKEELKDLLLYYSSKENGLVTLKEYIERNKINNEINSETDKSSGETDNSSGKTVGETDNSSGKTVGETDNSSEKSSKKEILYACGEDINSLLHLPNVDYAISNNREVLLLTDRIDEFVIKILNTYEDYTFTSINDFELDNSLDKSKLADLEKENAELLSKIADILKDKVSAVKLSLKLSNSISLLTSANDISLQMEKVLNAVNKENKAVSQRVLQLNPNHPLFNKLKSTQNLKAFATILYNEALLLSNLELDSPHDFCSSINELLSL